MSECKTYPAMNEEIKKLLRLGGAEEDPVGVYAAVRIEELESRLSKMEAEVDAVIRGAVYMGDKHETVAVDVVDFSKLKDALAEARGK